MPVRSRAAADIYQHDLAEEMLESCVFTMSASGPAVPMLQEHQLEAIKRITQGAETTSGIVHYPTGAGKTRVGIELMARVLRTDRTHRFIWATANRALIAQTMSELALAESLFPEGTRFAWCGGRDASALHREANILFLTRDALTTALEHAGKRKNEHYWREHLDTNNALTLIYDECHQLGAERLQHHLGKFYENVVAPSSRWRVVGLSATPVPTSEKAQQMLATTVFPARPHTRSTRGNWPFHVFHHVEIDQLLRQGALCPINLYFDRQGLLDLPTDLLAKLTANRLNPPPANASHDTLMKYATQFNKSVMSNTATVDFLTERLGHYAPLLGKTVVFAASIATANQLATQLAERYPPLRERIAVVHSDMSTVRLAGQQNDNVQSVLKRFRLFKSSEPAFLINVDMLTEGFNDPAIQSVVLARLTLSTNRFWQMIGRGTRGTRSGGTSSCFVIDPIKLTRIYKYVEGYQPSFTTDNAADAEDDLADQGTERLSPVVAHTEAAPIPTTRNFVIEHDLQQHRPHIATALAQFIVGQGITETSALDAAHNVRVEVHGDRLAYVSADNQFHHDTASSILAGELTRLEQKAARDLSWFRVTWLSGGMTHSNFLPRLRLIRLIELGALWTEDLFLAAERSATHLEHVSREHDSRSGIASEATTDEPAHDFTAAECIVADALLVIAAADGEILSIELETISDAIHKLFGRQKSAALDELIRSRAALARLELDALHSGLTSVQRQVLFRQMVNVAISDGRLVASECEVFMRFATHAQLHVDFVNEVLGESTTAVSSNTDSRAAHCCGRCRTEVPVEAQHCPWCGITLNLGAASML